MLLLLFRNEQLLLQIAKIIGTVIFEYLLKRVNGKGNTLAFPVECFEFWLGNFSDLLALNARSGKLRTGATILATL